MKKNFLLGLGLLFTLLFPSCHKRQPPDSLYESTYVCTGEVTRYPVYKVKATESLLATIEEETQHIQRNYPHYKITSYSGHSGAYDFITLSRQFRNDVVIAYDVSAFIEANKSDYHRMTKEEALSIVRYMVDQAILDLRIPAQYLKDIDSWPTISGGTFDVMSPGNGWRGRYEWEFGDWVHRLYSFDKMQEPWPTSGK